MRRAREACRACAAPLIRPGASPRSEVGGFPDYPLCEDAAFFNLCRSRSRVHCLPLTLLVSNRKFAERGAAVYFFQCWVVAFGFYLGVPAPMLVRWYSSSSLGLASPAFVAVALVAVAISPIVLPIVALESLVVLPIWRAIACDCGPRAGQSLERAPLQAEVRVSQRAARYRRARSPGHHRREDAAI